MYLYLDTFSWEYLLMYLYLDIFFENVSDLDTF